jgi:DNA-binding response OmpR family regulator
VSSPPSILLVEADRARGEAIARQLMADGYRVEHARSAEHARALAAATRPHLVLLAAVDPPHGWRRLLAEIRGRTVAAWDPAVAVIVLADGPGRLDVLRAFEGGADDFLARPTMYLELRARIAAVLRRSDRRPVPGELLEVGPLRMDTRARAVTLGGREVRLRRLEFDLLAQLASDPQRVFSRQELLRGVWGYRGDGSRTRTVDSHASRLRRKLARDGEREWIVSVRGVGYRLA